MTMVNLEIINVGQAPNDGTGDTHRDSFQKTNRNMAALKAALEDAFKTVEIPASANLNAYTTTGTFHRPANAGAVGGTNYPEGTAGLLQVVAAGTSFVYQRYVTTARRSYWRTRVGSVWTDWVRMLDASMLGAANGLASLGTDSKIPREQLPVMTAQVIVAGSDANAVTDPGSYYINSDADATAALNWPELRAGTLVVERAGAGNLQVTQTYTTRSGSGGVSRTYKRTRFTASLTWAGWQEQARAVDTFRKAALTAAVDANTLTTENVYYTWTSGVAMVGGANWPATIPGSGSLQVTQMNATNLVQSLTVFPGAGRRPTNFQRALISGTWGSWYVVAPVSIVADLPTAYHGDVYVDDDGWYAWNGTAYARRSLAKTLSDLDLNTIDVPGTYSCNVSLEATPALNYPVQLAGILEVVVSKASNLQVTQTYTAIPETSPITYKRVRFGASKVWGPWFEQARLRDAMHRVALGPAGVNFNTLTADNTFYTWVDGSTVSAGSNGPPVASNSVGAGYLNVWYVSAGFAVQECVLLINGQKPRRFSRIGSGSTWDPWKIIGSLSSTAYLPTADCGDVYVDNFGWCRWSTATSSYTGITTATGVFKLGEGTTVNGSFTGDYAAGISTVFQDNIGSTYLTTVPGPGGGYSGFIARNWKSPNAQFVLLGIDQNSGIGQLLFSKHGTAGMPIYFTINSATGECGRIIEDGRWQFGRFLQPNVQTKLFVHYSGGGYEYGLVFRPTQALDSTAIQFQSSTGGVCGYIYSLNTLSVVYSTTSDYRAKTELGDLDPETSLATINALRPINFRMNGAPEDSEVQRGFIAHELQALVPTAVVGKKDEMMPGPGGADAPQVPRYQGVDMGRIMPDMVAAVQCLTQMLEETNRSLVTANTRIAQLEAAGSPATPE